MLYPGISYLKLGKTYYWVPKIKYSSKFQSKA